MHAPLSARTGLALVIVGAILLSGGALVLTFTRSDPASSLFQHVLTIQVIGVLLLWSLLAWAARRLTVGKSPKISNSLATLLWGSSRVSLLVATLIVLSDWLIALALGLDIATPFIRAVVLLAVVTAFTGIIGGAFFNSVLAVQHWRNYGTQ